MLATGSVLRSWVGVGAAARAVCRSSPVPEAPVEGQSARGLVPPLGQLFANVKIKIEMWKVYKGGRSLNPRFSGHLRLVLSFVLSTLFDFYCTIFILWRVPRYLFFIKLVSISPNATGTPLLHVIA